LAIAGDFEVVLWNVQREALGRERAVALRGAAGSGRFAAGAPLPSVRFHPDGKQFAFNTWERAVHFEPLEQGGSALPRITGEGQPRSIAFDRQGKVFAVSWIDGRLGIYDAVTGNLIRSFPVAGANQSFQWM